jgi:hypothetical protein
MCWIQSSYERHLELEIKTLQNAPRDADKLKQLLELKQRQRMKQCTLKTRKEVGYRD